jgi:hypothetical protein
MAGSLAPRGSFGLPSATQRAAGRQARRAASRSSRAFLLLFYVALAGAFAAGLMFIALGMGLAFVVAAAFVVGLLVVGVAAGAVAEARAARRRRTRS